MEPVKVGAKFYSNSTSGNPGVIIKPSDNVAGIVLRTGIFSGSFRSIISTGTVAPTGASDATKPVVMFITGTGGPHQFQYPIYLPPGYGLWGYSNDYSSLNVFITYDIL